MTSVRAVVVVAHGGRPVSTAPTTAIQPAVLRMVPVAAAIRRAFPGGSVLVSRPRFLVQGWNGAQAAPVGDLSQHLDDLRGQFGPVPVVLIRGSPLPVT